MRSLSADVSFSKYSGAGNDFILIDGRRRLPAIDPISLCDRHRGIGADGVILLLESVVADLRMQIFNADGSEAEMCGNGVRCLVRFAEERGVAQGRLRIETMERVLTAWTEMDRVAVEMGDATDLDWGCEVEGWTVHLLNTGVPHAVVFVEDTASAPVDTVGPVLRKRLNANVNFVEEGDPLRVRTFERGVEGETLACGTGVTAAALVAAKVLGRGSPVTVQVAGGELLEIRFGSDLSHPIMVGPASKVFTGNICLPTGAPAEVLAR